MKPPFLRNVAYYTVEYIFSSMSFLGYVVKWGEAIPFDMERISRVTQNKCIPIGRGEVEKKYRHIREESFFSCLDGNYFPLKRRI